LGIEEGNGHKNYIIFHIYLSVYHYRFGDTQYYRITCCAGEEMDEKHGLEQGAVTQLAAVLAKREPSLGFQFVESLAPPMPDTRCKAEGRDLFVEVTHFYGTDADARYVLGRYGKAAPTEKERLESSCIPLRHRYLIPLNERLRDKAEKTYPVSPVWLLIRNGLALWQEEAFRKHAEEIVVPENHPFERILLLCGPRGWFGMIDLTELHNKTPIFRGHDT
jgi:hypothetical protein